MLTITVGTRLGAYEVLGPLGAGGMGVVFRARDTRLNRDVALKILPDVFASDPDRLARFEREAQTLASLNHPHIAHIHGVEEGAGESGLHVRALVMELVEGEDLSDRIARGPIPLDEALPIARQIAEALEAAHEQGVIHRDLKPANIKIRPDGTVKVLDFGLAKALGSAESGALPYGARPAHSPTITTPATLLGTVLGTAAYMAPEQAKGKAVDRRADIWAFGVVLYEMLTGRQLFAAETVAETIGLVVTQDPDLGALPTATPPRVRELLRRCLERDPKQRLRDAGEARIVLAAPSEMAPAAASGVGGVRRWRTIAIVAAAAVLLLLAGLAVDRYALAPAAPTATPGFAFEVEVPGKQMDVGSLALSPDGSHLAFRVRGTDGTSEIWVRPLGQPEARPLPGTREGLGSKPFWSPDGRHLGFFLDQDVWRIPLDGAAAQRIATSPLPPKGGAWGANDVILFGTESGPIYRIEAGGGSQPRAVTTVDSPVEDMHVFPVFLPDGKQFVFLADASGDEGHRIRLGSIERGDSKILLAGIRSSPTIDPQGALLIVQRGQLIAYPFDFRRGTIARESQLIADGVGALGDRHETPTAIGAHGILVFQRAAAAADLVRISLDPRGEATVATGERFGNPAIAPDGRSVAYDVFMADGSGRLIWIQDLERGVRTLISERGLRADSAAWSSTGDTVYFSSNADGTWKLYRKPATGASPPEAIGAPPETSDIRMLDCSDDGKYLLVSTLFRNGNWDLYLLPLGSADAKWKPWIMSPAIETDAKFSPDSRWIAYTSTTSGRAEIYVSALDDPSHRQQMSANGGTDPVWSPDGKRVLYLSATDQLMSVSVDLSGGVVRSGTPQALFELRSVGELSSRNVFDIMPDGKSILGLRRLATEDTTIHVRTGVRYAR